MKKVKNWDENNPAIGAGGGPKGGEEEFDNNGNDLLNDAELEAMDDKYNHLLNAY